jgi:acyl carrier protein
VDNVLFAKVLRAVARAKPEHAEAPRPTHRLVYDLGFDSLAIASLALALESEFGEAFLLNDWIVSAPQVSALTVASLAEFVAASLGEGA